GKNPSACNVRGNGHCREQKAKKRTRGKLQGLVRESGLFAMIAALYQFRVLSLLGHDAGTVQATASGRTPPKRRFRSPNFRSAFRNSSREKSGQSVSTNISSA